MSFGSHILGGGAQVSPIPRLSHSFNSAAFEYLSMSNADWGAYDRAKFALSIWVSPISDSSDRPFYSKGDNTTNEFLCHVNNGGNVQFSGNAGGAFNLVTTATISNSTYTHLMFHYDSANGTADDRIKIWIAGSEVTTFDARLNPSAAVPTTTGEARVGKSSNTPATVGNHYDGLLFQTGFFSGSLPAIGDVFDSGVKDISEVAGLYSLLDPDASIVTDTKRPNWTNNNNVTTSTTVP